MNYLTVLLDLKLVINPCASSRDNGWLTSIKLKMNKINEKV